MKRDRHGFTLIELLITVAIVVIGLAIAVPSFRELILNNRQAIQVNELLGSLNLARAEAVKRGLRTTVCKGSAAPGCETTTTGCCDTTVPTATNRNGWEQGWFVFVDTNEDSNLNDDAGDFLIQRRDPLPEDTTLRGNALVINRVIFNGRGGSGSAGTLRLCDSRGATEARGIVIVGSGRARRAIDTDSPVDGIVDDGNDDNLSCP
jgi:type IV fimbrial biogenesis protein FimT